MNADSKSRLSVGGALASIVASALLMHCLEPRDLSGQGSKNECARCHGSEEREESPLVQSAPPRDLAGNVDVAYPGVGAHALHLVPRGGYRAVACQDCHPVPERTDSPGHYDDERPADVVLGGLAGLGERAPEYDFATRRCSDTYCHGGLTERWTVPRSSEAACGSCHGLPPAPPHPQSAECWRCHGDVIDEKGRFVAPDLHVDGVVQTGEVDCSTCHGSADSPAPPKALDGSVAVAARGVGAHTAHLNAQRSRPVACQECHRVPSEINDAGHLDDEPGAEVIFSGIGALGSTAPSWARGAATCTDTYCHGPGSSMSWTESGPLSCNGCHGMPPPPPHPPMSDCGLCHGQVVSGDGTIRKPNLHVDGKVQVEVPQSCNACHGSEQSPAPPRDLGGGTVTTRWGVGAHERHLTPSGRARALSCNECHVVPASVLEEGHMDTALPAEVVFSGVARSYGANPRYEQGRCADTFCHGGSFVGSRLSGGSLTEPQWNLVDGSQTECGTCHALPPPPPHPTNADDCSQCHHNVRPDRTFIDPERHVDGIVDF